MASQPQQCMNDANGTMHYAWDHFKDFYFIATSMASAFVARDCCICAFALVHRLRTWKSPIQRRFFHSEFRNKIYFLWEGIQFFAPRKSNRTHIHIGFRIFSFCQAMQCALIRIAGIQQLSSQREDSFAINSLFLMWYN